MNANSPSQRLKLLLVSVALFRKGNRYLTEKVK